MSMFPPLKPHGSHVMRRGELNPGINKCALCGLTSLQDDVELPCGNADKDAEITKLKSQLEEARAENKRLRDGVEIMANPEHWGAALNLSTSIGIKAWDFARALLNGSAK